MDKERILAKVGELEAYLQELSPLVPGTLKGYQADQEARRACERLLHISIECVIDISSILVSGLKLGPPAGEEDLFEKLFRARVISSRMKGKLASMRGFRNVLVHRYGTVDDKMVFTSLRSEMADFRLFRKEILAFLKKTR